MATSPHSPTKQRFNDCLWISSVRSVLEEENEREIEAPVRIFNVPNLLKNSDPDSYSPHEISIGPYYHSSSSLYAMERYKLAAVKRFQMQLKDGSFENIVAQITCLDLCVRSLYHKMIDLSPLALSWRIAIDACFLLEFLSVYAVDHGGILPPTMSHLLTRCTAAHNAVVRDLVMLENQIPLMVLRKMMEIHHGRSGDEILESMICEFVKEISPFQIIQTNFQSSKAHHLLDSLYQLIVPKLAALPDENEEESPEVRDEEGNPKIKLGKTKNLTSYLMELLKVLGNAGFRPVKLLAKIPWSTLADLPGVSRVTSRLDSLVSSKRRTPLIEEIKIPSVTELGAAGIGFRPIGGSFMNMKFDEKCGILYLPEITLDINTEVVMKNLVAYETADTSSSCALTRFTEIMNGIIDTEKDVKVLKSEKILQNHLKNDKEAANLWNGMRRSVKFVKVPDLDKVVEDVNKYYNKQWKVKSSRMMRHYIYDSWQILTFLACILLIGLMALEAVCSVYTCKTVKVVGTT